MQLTNFTSREAIKQRLIEFKPKNKSEAIKPLQLLSVLKSVEKQIKQACYDFLDNRCGDCANHIDPDTGMEVVLVETTEKVYNETEELKDLLEQEKALKEKIKKAKERAGFTLEE